MRSNFQSLGNKPNPVLGLLRSDRPGQLWALRDQGVHAVLGPDHVRHVLHHQHHRPAQPAYRHDEPLVPAHLSQLGEWTIYQKLRKGSFLQQKLMFCRNMSQNWMSHVMLHRLLGEVFIDIILGGMSFSQFCLSFKLICLKLKIVAHQKKNEENGLNLAKKCSEYKRGTLCLQKESEKFWMWFEVFPTAFGIKDQCKLEKKILGKNGDTHALKSSYRCFCAINVRNKKVVGGHCNIREGRDTCHKNKLTNKTKAPLYQSRSFKRLWNLGQTSAWFCLAKGKKYIEQLWQIHVTTVANLWCNFDKSM